MTAATTLEQTIRDSIPLSEAMQFSIRNLDIIGIEVSAPLQPNINIHGTGFAGSIYSVAVLTGWALCTHLMKELGMVGDLVVAKAAISYRAPVTAELECRCFTTAQQRDSFQQGWHDSGKGRLSLEIEVGDKPQAILQASYVAVKPTGQAA
jgi:thioesterase domain-containing protein